MNVLKIPTALQFLREVISERAISPAMAKRAGLRYLTKEEARAASDLSWLTSAAIEIPYFDPAGGRKGYVRWKLLGDAVLRYVARKNSGSSLYFPPGSSPATLAASSKPLYIIEGELKTLSAVDNLGIDAVGISGVYNFLGRRSLMDRATPLPDLDLIEWIDRKVVICFDSDWGTNIEVRHALLMLGIELTSRGAKVEVLDLPTLEGKKSGIDDWVVDCRRRRIALKKAFDALPRKNFDAADHFDGLSEVDFARRLRAHFSHRLRFLAESKRWLVLNERTQIWEEDKTGEVMRLAKKLPSILLRESQHIGNDERRRAFILAAANVGNKKRLDAAVALLESEPGISILVRDLDSDVYLLGMPGAMALDLQEGVERPLLPGDYVTKTTGTQLGVRDGQGCPRFLEFLKQICLGDPDYIAYVQRAMGYCLSGDISEQCIFIQYGVGANGKSTLLSVLRAVLGDYAVQASPETFMVQRGAGTRGDLVRLRGARVVATSELEDGQRLAESIVKQWTGGEAIVARQLYSEFIEFAVTGKLFIATNHKPKIRGIDYAIWRRIHLWPFELRLPKEKQDPKILESLKRELPGILRWMLEGYREWRQTGLRPPSRVMDATAEYRSESDALGTWINDCCLLEPTTKSFGTQVV